MSTAASDNQSLPAPTSAVWPVLFLGALAVGFWAVTVRRMRGNGSEGDRDRPGPRTVAEDPHVHVGPLR